jgi:protoporphyrinogen oxidase
MPASDRWGIIGGGMLGMALAHRLRQQGKDVTLCESAHELGGLASAWEVGGIVWDRHYHVTLLSDTHLRSLLAELALDQDIRWVETRTGFYTGGELYSLSNSFEFLRFPPLGLIDKVRLAGTIFYASRLKDWRKLEKVSVSDWLRRWSGTHTFEKIWLPLLRAKLGDNYTKASAAFIWAIIARMYAARRTGLKKEMFGYVPGGYARVLARFGDVLQQEGVEVRLGHTAREVLPRGDGTLHVHFANGQRETFDRVALTVAAPLAARLCPALSPDERARLEGVSYQGIVCVSLLLKKPLSGFYVTNITDSWVPFTAVIEMSAVVDRQQFGGNALVFLPKYVDPADPFFSLSDGEIQEEFLEALEWMYPAFSRDDVLAFRISRVRYVFPIATLNYSDRLPPTVTSVPGLYTVNSAHIVNGTLNVNETVQLAERAAAELGDLPQAPLPLPPGRMKSKPLASLSLDLDNQWSYLKTHGDPWETLPSYLDVLVPRLLTFFRQHQLTITFFIVGQDAAVASNRELLREIARAGHEIGNHSFHHEPWLHLYTPQQVEEEIARAEEHIERATGRKPIGFRGPGFSLTGEVLRVLASRGYLYDASTFPTYLIPLARAWYFMTARFNAEEKRLRKSLGGTFGEGMRSLRPYRWETEHGPVIEMPVTTMPVFKLPMHLSYLHCLGMLSPRLALCYFDWALRLCRWTGKQPSLLLHPTDFLGCDDTTDLAFFPAMRLPSEKKLALTSEVLRRFAEHYTVVTVEQHAKEVAGTMTLPLKKPDFPMPEEARAA